MPSKTDTERQCTHCGLVKPIDQFYSSHHKSVVCLPCREQARKDRNNTAKRLNGNKKEYNRRYSRTRKESARQLAAQGKLEGSSVPPSVAKGAPKSKRRLQEIREGIKHPRTIKAEDPKLKAELARRAVLRRSLLNFIVSLSNAPGGYEPGWVHKLICAKLEKFRQDVADRKSPRLMLFLPPRSGKSEIASKMFPAWYLGHHPDHELIACSYALALPLEFSKKIKDVVRTPEYKGLFPRTLLSRDSQATEMWKTSLGGGYIAAGVQGPITGKGAHVLIIDDPVKDAEEADSETVRKKTWSWYGSTARTRLAPGGGILLIMTRWHDADLAGELLLQDRTLRKEIDETYYQALKDGASEEELEQIRVQYGALENWEVISFEALAESDEWWDQTKGKIVYAQPETGTPCITLRRKGEALHPARFNHLELLKLKNTLQPRHWSALYQQNPTPDEGSTFTRDMIRYVPSVPDHTDMYTFAAWDLAVGLRQENDYTAGIIGGLDHNGDLYVLDVVHARMRLADTATAIIDKALKYNVTLTGVERGQLEQALRPELETQLRLRKESIALAEGKEALVPVTDKMVRARPLQGLMQRGMVYFPSDQEWTETVVGELLRFPNGMFDDCVDGMSWLARMVLKSARPPVPHEQFNRVKPPSWKDKLRQLQRRKHYMAA